LAKLTDRQKEELQLLSIELDDNGKRKYTQQELADKFGISKGMVNRYIKEKVNKVNKIVNKEVELIGDFEKLQEEKSKHLTKSEQIEVNKQIQSKLYYQGRIFSQIEKALNINDKILDDGFVEEKINVGDGMQKFDKRSLNTNDTLNVLKGADQASLTLGINQRHSSTANVAIQNNQQNGQPEIEGYSVETIEN